jgi:hypothetical protein
MSTVTVNVNTRFNLSRVKTFATAFKIALTVVAESTTQSDVSNPLRPSIRDLVEAEMAQITYRDYAIRIGKDSKDYCVVFPDGRVRFGEISEVKGDIDAWFTGALQGH